MPSTSHDTRNADGRRFVRSDRPSSDDLVLVAGDLHADMGAFPLPVPSEAAGLVVPGAVVSLHSVLGETGVVPRPSRIVMSVAHMPDVAPGGRKTVDGPFGEFLFFSMPLALIEAGDADDRLDSGPAYAGPYSHARATSEKALCDWLWISTIAEGEHSYAPPLDSDLDEVDMDRLSRLAEAMGIEEVLGDWIGRLTEHQSDSEHGEQFGARFSA